MTEQTAADEWLYPWPKPVEEEEVVQEKTLQQKIEGLIPDPRMEVYESHPEYLRAVALTLAFRQVMQRIAENPTMRKDEENLGVFEELLEPQVRSAVMLARSKGYQTSNSGFSGDGKQMLEFEGGLHLSEEVKNQLAGIGVGVAKVDKGERLEFSVEDGDTLDTLTDKWVKVASLLPDTGKRPQAAWQTGTLGLERGNLVGLAKDPNSQRRKAKLFREIEKDDEIELHFPRYLDVSRKLRRLILDTPVRK